MKQGDIWLVKYPDNNFGHEFFKERPALLVESDEQIKKTNIFTVAAITSNTNNITADDIIIRRDKRNSLALDSVIKMHHIQTFAFERFIKLIGVVDEGVLLKAKFYLKKHFGL